MKKTGYEKRSFPGPYPEPHTIEGRGKMPPEGDAQPTPTDRDDDSRRPPHMKEHVIGAAAPAGEDFGPYIDHRGEGLYHSFNLNFTNDIPYNSGGLHPHTGLLLFALALNLRPDVIVETGTYYGTSTMYLARVCEVWGHGKVYTIDPMDDHIAPEIKKNPYVECLKGMSRAVLTKLVEEVGQIDFAFLDSFKRLAWQEFTIIDPYIPEGGIIAFHDTQFLNSGRTLYQHIIEGSRAYQRILFAGTPHVDNPHRFFGNADDRGLLILRKQDESPFLDVADSQSAEYGASQIFDQT